MRVCIVSFKECWREPDGRWMSTGGFPVQMRGIASLFASAELMVVEVAPRVGGEPLPVGATVVPLRKPSGRGLRRKVSVLAHLPYYATVIGRHAHASDVVHVPLPGDIPVIALVVALCMRKRVLARYGGSWSDTTQTTRIDRVVKRLVRACAGGRNVMLATGVGSAPPAPGMHWLPATAISSEEVRRVPLEANRPRGRPLRLVYAGRLSPEKGVHQLLAAMGVLTAHGSTNGGMPILRVVGDGEERGALERTARDAGLGDAVQFAGQLERSRLLDELRRADVCVLPSLTESFGKARIDAMLCGVPVLTTEVGFGRQIVGSDGERGWIVPAGDVEALAAMLLRIESESLDWPMLRMRCRTYAESLTTEWWVEAIGRICAAQWAVRFASGRLET